jgi:hydroxymethylpyrimidine/phosphomethylpyrimidine kinase
MNRASVLVFAGMDPSGGAGIQADIQAIAAHGVHPLAVVTALTVQDNDRVFAVHPVSATLVQQQAQALLQKIDIAAVKIGIVGARANALTIADLVKELRQSRPNLPVVFDPVLASGHGDALAVENAVHAVTPLLSMATLITPNLPEAYALCGGEQQIDAQARSLLRRGCGHVLVKGGHGASDSDVTNLWFAEGHTRSWSWPRLAGAFHGSGCTLAAAIAALLAIGKTMEQALDQAQAYCQEALASSYTIAPGQRIPDRFNSSFRGST